MKNATTNKFSSEVRARAERTALDNEREFTFGRALYDLGHLRGGKSMRR